MKNVPMQSPRLVKYSGFDASDSTITNSLLEGLEVPQQTLHDLIILFLTSIALNESKQLPKIDISDIMTQLSELIALEVPRLSMTVDDSTRLDIVFRQLSELLSVSKPARESISSRIMSMINDFFRKCLLIDSDIYTYIHHNSNPMFDDFVVPNLLGMTFELTKSNSISS
jgi:hypothetical protein